MIGLNENQRQLAVIDGETLMDMRLPPTRFCVETLLPQGVSILGGAPKIGKSWLVLDLCIHVAKGEPLWDLPTQKGTTLYLCLEDSLRRVQERLCRLTDEVPSNAYFATAAGTLADGLREQVCEFVKTHPDTVLVVIDTFQIVRANNAESSYAGDYEEVRQMKSLADEMNISLLLVHHLRKLGDSDPLNKLSGTTGISGGVDAAFVLDKSRRNAAGATLICTGRDIEYRELELQFSKESCAWELRADSLENPQMILPDEMERLIEFMRDKKSFSGTNTCLAQQLERCMGKEVSAKSLKQMMNRWRYPLEENGVRFESRRSNGQRLVDIFFSSANDAVTQGTQKVFDPKTFCVPCVTVGPTAVVYPADRATNHSEDKDPKCGGCGQTRTKAVLQGILPFREGKHRLWLYSQAHPPSP